MNRSPIFATLDDMILFGWGDVPQNKIPENWRDIPREVREHDLERVIAEELTPERTRIQAIEHANRLARIDWSLTERVMAAERDRVKANIAAGKLRKVGSGHPRGKSNRPWPQRVEWRQAAMRARRASA